MAAKEMYDYLSAAVADKDVTLSVAPQEILTEQSSKNTVIHLGDDGSEVRVNLSDASIFYVTLQWDYLDESDSGTVIDFWNDTVKGNGMANSFKWGHPTDGHTYVVRFASDLSRFQKTSYSELVKSD